MQLYYDNPLIVPYMVTEFGITVESRHTDDQMDEYDIPEAGRYFPWFNAGVVDAWTHQVNTVCDAVEFIKAASGKIYVHSDSHDVFELRTGDVIEVIKPPKYPFVTTITKLKRWEGSFFSSITHNETFTILQRDGKPFFMPKQED